MLNVNFFISPCESSYSASVSWQNKPGIIKMKTEGHTNSYFSCASIRPKRQK